MSGYFGTAQQQLLQSRAEQRAGFIGNTPGACQAGRTMGCDDPDRLGWDRIDDYLERDGVCSFRLVPAARVDELRAQLARRQCRLDTWDVFLADRAAAMAACQTILAKPMPEGVVQMEAPTDPQGEVMTRVQALMAAAGVVPFSGSFLAGELGAVKTVVGSDGGGAVVVAAHGYMPHNAHSPYHRYAWSGLVAVAESHRGRGLGTWVNARTIAGVFAELDATHIYELVSSTNLASRRMVQVCGLRFEPGLVCGVATREDSPRFTR